MEKYIDTHAHYIDDSFGEDRTELVGRLLSDCVECIVEPATDLATSREILSFAARFDNYYCAAGIHPHEAGSAGPDDVGLIRELIASDARGAKKIVAVGETGLDFHYDFSPRDIQESNFRSNIRLALEYSLPLIVHDREAHERTFEILREENAFDTKVLFHCYSGSAGFAEMLIPHGVYFSFGGAVTSRNSKKFEEIFRTVPYDRILPETDSPYMAPEPVRGTRNDSSNLVYIYKRISELTGTSAEELARIFRDNTGRFFGITI